jgi:hypothetical protein
MAIRLGKTFRPDLGREIIEKLEDFCTAHHSANPTEVVRKALNEFIPRDLATNEGVRVIFDALQAKRERAG